MKVFFKILCICSLIFSIASCASMNDRKQAKKEKKDTELSEKVEIDTDKLIEEGLQTVEETKRLGPQPLPEGENVKKERRFIIKEESSVYSQTMLVEDTFPITINLDNVDVAAAMRMFGDLINKNILVGEEVEGTITAYIQDEPWDKTLEAILEIKGLAKIIEPNSRIIRIHKKEELLAQVKYKKEKAQNLQDAIDLEKQTMPTRSELFRLFYSEPNIIKTQLEDILFRKEGTAEAPQLEGPVSITEDSRQNSLIIKGTKDDLDLIEKMIDAIDVRTAQILIEAFIIEATLDFDNILGTRFGANYAKRRTPKDGREAGTNLLTIGGVAGTAGDVVLGGTTGTISDLAVGSISTSTATAGIGFLYNLGANRLKIELDALESEGLTTLLSNPKVFTLNNEKAIVKQGLEIPYAQPATGGQVASTEFKDAVLALEVTPSIVGDGNIILDLLVKKDSKGTDVGTVPAINKMEIRTKLLVEDGSIVVIGGIFSDEKVDNIKSTPVLSKIPLFGRIFRGKETKKDKKQLLVFIAPRIV